MLSVRDRDMPCEFVEHKTIMSAEGDRLIVTYTEHCHHIGIWQQEIPDNSGGGFLVWTCSNHAEPEFMVDPSDQNSW